MTTPAPAAMMLEGLRLLVRHGGIVEVRIPHSIKGTVSGYFDKLETAVGAIVKWDGKANIYVTANPVVPALLARAHNRLREYARETTADKDITSRAWFLVDFDPVRPAGISATDTEVAAALARREDAVAFLGELGFPEPARAMSGNGGHGLWAVNLPNDADTTTLVERAVKALKARFSDGAVLVDDAVCNAARIWKVYGTLSVKGDPMPDRPHRRATVESRPPELVDVPRDMLARLATMTPPARTVSLPGRGASSALAPLDLVAVFGARGLYKRALGAGKHAVLCPWAAEHSGDSGVTESCLFEPKASGEPWGFDCKHSHCADRTIRDVLALLMPRAAPGSAGHAVSHDGGMRASTEERRSPWDAAQPIAAFLAGEDNDVQYLDPLRSLVPGALSEWFAPRGLGKTLVLHALLVGLAREGKRVLLLDRDNPKREIKRRLRGWGAGDLVDGCLKVMTRDETPPLTDHGAWKQFPFADYDVVALDSLDASTEGVGEQDSAKPARAIAALLDLAHRACGPAVIMLGNTTKSGGAGRGSGVIEDRADIVYEIRDATDFTPIGKAAAWWEELPPAARIDWASRATRRKRRGRYRLAIIATKHRVGPEPDPRIVEIDLTKQPWIWRDVTADLIAAGEQAREDAERGQANRIATAIKALVDELGMRLSARTDMPSKKEAEALLHAAGVTQKVARKLLVERHGRDWRLTPRDGKTVLVTPVVGERVTESTDSADPREQRGSCMSNAVDRMNTRQPHFSSQNLGKRDEKNTVEGDSPREGWDATEVVL